MAELRVGKLMQPSRGGHTEVAPNIAAAAEVELLHGSRPGLKPVVRVLSGDAARDAVAVGGGAWVGADKGTKNFQNSDNNSTSSKHTITTCLLIFLVRQKFPAVRYQCLLIFFAVCQKFPAIQYQCLLTFLVRQKFP